MKVRQLIIPYEIIHLLLKIINEAIEAPSNKLMDVSATGKHKSVNSTLAITFGTRLILAVFPSIAGKKNY